jgi:hypothetical protein
MNDLKLQPMRDNERMNSFQWPKPGHPILEPGKDPRFPI